MSKPRRYIKPQRRKHTAKTVESKARSMQTCWRRATDKSCTLSLDEAREILKRETICPYCHELVASMELSIDHKIPRSRSGSSDPTNLVWCHKSCNLAKADLTATEYLGLIEWLDAHAPEVKRSVLTRLRAGSAVMFKRRH